GQAQNPPANRPPPDPAGSRPTPARAVVVTGGPRRRRPRGTGARTATQARPPAPLRTPDACPGRVGTP
ncbi:hypothetical protein ACFYNZ_08715, partial [Streptomyces kebangsaanensis]